MATIVPIRQSGIRLRDTVMPAGFAGVEVPRAKPAFRERGLSQSLCAEVLERFGVIQVTERPLPGHGRQKWVSPLAKHIRLTAVL